MARYPYLSPQAVENLELTLRYLLRAHKTGFISHDSLDGLGEELAATYGCEFHIARQLVIMHTARAALAMLEDGSWD